jgi:hypothetical protein
MFENVYDGLLKLIIAISTGVLGIIPGIEGNDASFTNTELVVRNNKIFISTEIQNTFSERIDDIIKSGRKINLKITVESFIKDRKKPFDTRHIYKFVEYDLLKQQYYVSYRDFDKIGSFEKAEIMWQNFLSLDKIPVFTAKDFSVKAEYYLKISAQIETELEIGGRSVDLMLFWNNKIPEYKTESFNNSIFTY